MQGVVNKFEKPALKKSSRRKVKEWLKRFFPAEIAGTVLALTASYLVNYLTHNKVLAAYAGSIGDTAGFYTVVLIQSYHDLCRQLKIENQKISFHKILQVLKNIMLDYGVAEIIDSFFLRPFLMYIFPVLLNNYPLGIFVGKIVSDIGFYIPVIISYEIRMLFSKKPGKI